MISNEPRSSMLRPTQRFRTAQNNARQASQLMSPAEMGSARVTRHSFSRAFTRTAAKQKWQVTTELFDIDKDGKGTVIYKIDTEGRTFRFVSFCTTIREDQRIDRVIAQSWDVTAALVDGEISPERLDNLRNEVPRQEGGRADEGTLIWTRANRSARFFDYIVDQLAAGLQPSLDVLGDTGYILRSTAFYGNGKWGTIDFEGYEPGGPLALPYRAQMLSAWLLRELSYDLVEHCAKLKSEHAVKLAGDWRRYFGLGNATGLGMVPYVITHPVVLDAWAAARELPLTYALSQESDPASPRTETLLRLFARAEQFFKERNDLETAPFPSYPSIAEQIHTIRHGLIEYRSEGTFDGAPTTSIFQTLHDRSAKVGLEVRQVVDSILVECFEELDEDVEALLVCDEYCLPTFAQTCSSLLSRLREDYGWLSQIDFEDPPRTHYFWFYSADSQEPRRMARTGSPNTNVEIPVGVALSMRQLMTDLEGFPADTNLADFLIQYPCHRGAIDRAQLLAGIPYGEPHVNLLDEEFLPLALQRFQLAMYGMENFNPQSTDWLRVTLFGGAPRASDISAGTDGDWLFSTKPDGAIQ